MAAIADIGKVQRTGPATPASGPVDRTAAAAEIQARYRAELDSISGNATLSHTGRQSLAAKAYVAASGQLRQLHEADDRARVLSSAAELGALWREGDLEVDRASRQAAEGIETPADAYQRYEQARADADWPAAKAIMQAVTRRAAAEPDGEFAALAVDYLQATGDINRVREHLRDSLPEAIVAQGKFYIAKDESIHDLDKGAIQSLATRDLAAEAKAARQQRDAAYAVSHAA